MGDRELLLKHKLTWRPLLTTVFFCITFFFTLILMAYLLYTLIAIGDAIISIDSLKLKAQCTFINDSNKFDCYPEGGVNEESCTARGCCWSSTPKVTDKFSVGIPSCFYPKNYGGYKYVNVTATKNGIVAYLNRTSPSPYQNDVKLLRIEIDFQSEDLMRIKICDPFEQRYESLYPKIKTHNFPDVKNSNLKVDISKDTPGFVVSRSNGDIVHSTTALIDIIFFVLWPGCIISFDTRQTEGFIFSDQFLQISAQFYGKIFGLGEHRSAFQLETNWTLLTLFNEDIVPLENINLYGSHPFYMVLEPNGSAHGVFLLNSNAMDVLLQPLPAITFRSIGGIFDFYFFAGPKPADVVRQYVELIGKPAFPPYWSLGFHLCRYGYKNVSHIEAVLNRTLSSGIPVDTQWVDIDYMANNNDFTLNNSSFNKLPEFVELLHHAGMHFVPILDPGVSAGEPNGTYPPFDEGTRLGVFIRNQDNSTFIGKVWNMKSTAFPDFTNLETSVYWTGLIHKLHDVLPFDGLWIDMNEPSNFLNGTKNGCPNNTLENPQYLPGGRKNALSHKTVCMSALQKLGLHYNLHNLYGISEADVTHRALKEILQKRPFVISRSTFSGIGHYSGHWGGDIGSTWHDMKRTIPQLLSFSIFGVPLMGSDICGFNGNTTKDLCLRWSQLGAFYPFSRNHNTDDGVDQDPAALGADVAAAAKKALLVRYSLLPYLYTLFWEAHKFGKTVARPIFFEFFEDANTHDLDETFLWGCCVLIAPVLKEMSTTVDTYLPAGRWYDWYTLLGIESSGVNVSLHAPYDSIPVLIRGGVVLPTQEPAINTAFSRKNKMMLLAAFNTNLTATGSLYWDDGESIHISHNMTYGLVEFKLNSSSFISEVSHWNTPDVPNVATIKILGFYKQVKEIEINGNTTAFYWNSTSLVLSLEELSLPVNMPLSVTWS